VKTQVPDNCATEEEEEEEEDDSRNSRRLLQVEFRVEQSRERSVGNAIAESCHFGNQHKLLRVKS